MLDLIMFMADIENELTHKGMSIEFWATREEEAEEKLNWLISGDSSKKWMNLKEIGR